VTASVAVYHFTPLENAARIVATGGFLPNRTLKEANVQFTDIGDASIKKARDERVIECLSDNGRVFVGDCVPWYLAMHPPMYWLRKPMVKNLVYFETSLGRLLTAGQTVVCSDGNAASRGTSFHRLERSRDLN
jgi:hypothetical protein